MVNSAEVEMDPFAKRGHRFLERKAHVTELWQKGEHREALSATEHRYASTIFDLFQENPNPSWAQIAKAIGKSRTFAENEVTVLKDLGIPLGKD